MAPTAQQVADFIGQGDDAEAVALAGESLPIITAMATSYTRGVGFTNGEPTDAISAVIVTATARLMSNPTFLKSEGVGGYSVTPGVFLGWTLAESFVLNQYRRRSQ